MHDYLSVISYQLSVISYQFTEKTPHTPHPTSPSPHTHLPMALLEKILNLSRKFLKCC
ncbi:Ribonuclease III [Microcystis panniformis FACHB-1757]|uniref:Ribonuclease III n=1 Tax=Microcystis panniformis FACHB-1757 TaxID=1638788 RepID=A0A0K1SAL9_9CHRO|nr:Ribonuclease III [Microcystis panniformis FACHB-1757]